MFNIIKVGSILFYVELFARLVLRVGSDFLLDKSPKPHLQKVLPCGHPCHPWDLGLVTKCEPPLNKILQQCVSPNGNPLIGLFVVVPNEAVESEK